MSAERLAEIRERSKRHPILAEADMPEVLAEVERLRAELEKRRAELAERLVAVPGESWPNLLDSAEKQGHAMVDAQNLALERIQEREAAEAKRDEMAARLDAAWTVVREGTANMRGLRATLTAERDAARTDAELRRDERDRLAEQVAEVRILHSPMTLGERTVCSTCPDEVGWPCPTRRALDGTEP